MSLDSYSSYNSTIHNPDNTVNQISENYRDSLLFILEDMDEQGFFKNFGDFIEKSPNVMKSLHDIDPSKYIRVKIRNSRSIELDVIDMPGEGVDGMLYVIYFALQCGYYNIHGKAQAIGGHSTTDMEKVKKRVEKLKGFYGGFGAKIGEISELSQTMNIDITPETAKVLMNKCRYYMKHGKWFFG